MTLYDDEFVAQVADAYEHLYDLVYLRTHPLLARLAPEHRDSPKERAWRLHQLLLETIAALDPGPDAPVHARAGRRHQLMALRYQEGLEVEAVARELGIGRRHYFREHKEALIAAAGLLATSAANQPAEHQELAPATTTPAGLERLEILRLEAARLSRSNHQVNLAEVVQGAAEVACEMARQRGTHIRLELPPDMPLVNADRNTLRQLLLSLLSHLLAPLTGGEVTIHGRQARGRAVLSLTTSGVVALSSSVSEAQVQLSMLNELAAMQSVSLRSLDTKDSLGFEIDLPTAQTRTVLVVDDNEDVLRLFQRYLTQNDYQVITAQTATEAIEKARELQPYAVTLDLMMPERDGWDVLRILTNQLATRHIPIIICTILAAKEMALSLGASAFLAKPISEQALIEALAALGN